VLSYVAVILGNMVDQRIVVPVFGRDRM
jgi:hypothetical protein